MPNFTDHEVLEIIVERNHTERAPSDAQIKAERYRLAKDLYEARIVQEFWKSRAGRFDEEIKRLRGLLREAGRPDLAEGPDYPCIAEGCRNEAAIGAKLCKEIDTHDNLEIELCFVRSCDNKRIHPLTPFCWEHKSSWRDHGGDAFSFAEDLALGRPWPSPWDRMMDEEEYYEDPEEERVEPRAPASGPPAPVPGLGDQVSVHGLPPTIEPSAVGAALTQGVASELDAPPTPQGESPRLCVFAQCGAPREPGHALCKAHL